MDFFLIFFRFFVDLLFNLNAREYQKFDNPEREYRIPEIPEPGKFGNTEFPKNSHSRTSVFPEKKIREWPLPSMHLSLVQKIVSKFILQGLKIYKLSNFQTKKLSQLHKDKVYWSETIFSFWSSNVFPIQISE